MPHSTVATKRRVRQSPTSAKNAAGEAGARYTVALAPGLSDQVERYAQTADISMSKAIAALVRLGLQGQESRKREFYKKLKENLGNDDPSQQDQLIDDFRNLILGR